jgi:hypothetical protein
MKDKARAFADGDNTGGDGKNLTEAQKLLQLLQADPQVSYHALYSERDSVLMTSNRRDFNTAQKRLRSVIRFRGETMERDGELFDFDDIDNCTLFILALVTSNRKKVPVYGHIFLPKQSGHLTAYGQNLFQLCYIRPHWHTCGCILLMVTPNYMNHSGMRQVQFFDDACIGFAETIIVIEESCPRYQESASSAPEARLFFVS